mgnify:CR=1 FL=1|tara:strand:+ start:151 stop:603 length:453 start_codon:yes stop_codon:yes gene_type:complete
MDRIAIASDHAGYDLKLNILCFLKNSKLPIEDLGTHSSDSVDYPDYGVKVARAINKKEIDRGIIICGTGIGMSIVVNRFPGIRGALCGDIYTAQLCRRHNDSNILILGGRVLGIELANEIVNTWMITPFEGGRHQRRLDKIEDMIQNEEI